MLGIVLGTDALGRVLGVPLGRVIGCVPVRGVRIVRCDVFGLVFGLVLGLVVDVVLGMVVGLGRGLRTCCWS